MTATKKTTTKTKKPRTVTVKKPASLDLPRNPFIFEILDLVSRQRSKAKKIEVLKKYEDISLKTILIWNFDETVISILPEGQVPYKENEVPVGTDHTSLRKEYANLYHFVKGGNDSLSAIRRETMFIQMLEGLHPQEADILTLVKDGGLERQYPKITKGVVDAAFPDIVWGSR